jgi:hypothetical protein
MLYYRLYKRMKRNFGFHSAITMSLDYVTFVVLIPTGVGFAVSRVLETFFGLSETLSYFSIFVWMAVAALYIHLCSRRDKEP